jgi:transglutaminase-like putative cysteine protease
MTIAPPQHRRASPAVVPARIPDPPADAQAPPVYLMPTLIGALAVLAATLAIPPMISGNNWFWQTVEVVLVIWLVGVGARLARVPAAAAVLLQFAGAAVALTALFTVGGIGGVIPNGAVIAEAGELLTGAWSQIRSTVSPAPASVELAFLICVSVGATALIVDILIAVCRAPALVALPLLCVYSVPASIDLGMLPWEAFVAPAMLYVLLLIASGLSGRRLGAGAGLAQVVTGVSLGAIATVIALLAANAVTGVGTAGRLPRSTDAQSTGVGLSPFASLQGNLERSEPVEMLRVAGLGQPRYLRTVGLEQWTTGEGWSVDQLVDGQLPDQVPLAGEPLVTVSPVAYRDQFLPIYNGTTTVSGVDQGWSYDSALESVHRSEAITPDPYTIAVAFPERTAEQLRADTVTAGGSLTETGELPERAITLAQELTAAAPTAFDKADALLQYFTDPANGFQYSLNVPQGPSGDALLDFLDNKQGYCEQYASAMAIMLRSLEIPARVAIGFTQGTPAADGSYSISSNDAHAWVEVFFDGAGWVQFDPTPLGAGQGGQQGFSDAAGDAPSTSAAPSEIPAEEPGAADPTLGAAAPSAGPSANTSADGDTTDEPVIPAGLWWALLVVALVVAAAAGPTIMRQRRTRQRLSLADSGAPGAAAAAWREIEDLAVDHGLGLDPAESARATANRLAKSVHLSDQGRTDLRVVVTQAERSWYGQDPASGTEQALGAAPRTIAVELQHLAPLSPLERLVPRSVRPAWWRD